MALTEEHGWFTSLLTALRDALVQTFDQDYPIKEFRGLSISLDFPADVADYPGVWVDFEPTGELETVGIDHREFGDDEDGDVRSFKRWRFMGYATYTVVALSSLERARLLDEMVRILAFGKDDTPRSRFRAVIEDNEFLGINFDFDQIGITGKAETTGTPWETNDTVYEITVRMECVGEFVSDLSSGVMVPLTSVEVHHSTTEQPDPGSVPPLSDDPAEWQ